MIQEIPTTYVLLIGIDYYQPNRLYRSLKGAVRDINLVETFLRETLKIPTEYIYKLISPNQDDMALPTTRSAQVKESGIVTRSAQVKEPAIVTGPDSVKEPTYENIVNAFQEITEKANPGEQVYIHYSGHGGRATSIYPFKRELYDEGLVPMDIGDTEEGRYLRDVELTTLLKRMTDKGLIVTVVLDSCHSGGVTRGDAEIRSAEEPDTLKRSSISLVENEPGELERNWIALTKERSIHAAGLIQAKDYVLLAACRPDEFAYEYAVNGGSQRNGALTYWMIDTLTSVATSGQALTYKLLYDRLIAQIQSKFSHQTPMILGKSDRLVFGSSTWTTPFTIVVIKVVSDTQVTLNAGQAQGLSKGLRFSIYPFQTTNFTDKSQQVAIVEITRIEASESTARVLQPEEGGIEVKGKLEPGAPAIMVSAPIDLIQRVRLIDHKVEGEQANELPAHWVGRQKEAIEQVRQALSGTGWLVEEGEGETALYQVAIDREGNYEICKNIPLPNLRPLLSIEDPTAPQQVVDRLVHLAKYQAVESLDNSGSTLAAALEVEVLTEDGKPFPDSQNLTIKSEEIICLRLTNRGRQSLKIALLELGPTWEIAQIPLGGMEEPFFLLAAGDTKDVSLELKVSEGANDEQSKEILKVFAVQKGLADFRWLTLPPLNTTAEPKGMKLFEELQGIMEQTTTSVKRGEEPEGINPLNHLMAMIGADLDHAPTATRSATVVVNPRQEWVTKQVQVIVQR